MAGQYVRLRVPIDEGLNERLQAFWHSIFGDAPDIEPDVFLGSESSYNTSDLYLVEEDGRAISTAMATTCNALPELGGFGEVATLPEARGRGLATDLCRQSVEDFAAACGRALFLGTVNPAAARIYHRLGWRKLASSIVWALITDDRSPEAYLVDYFSNPGPAVVEEGGPGARIPMIPLIVTPHDWQVLDANTGIFSARYALVRSCMGLYPKYQAVREGGRGSWFAARDAQRNASSGCRQPSWTTRGDAASTDSPTAARTTPGTTCSARPSTGDRPTTPRRSTRRPAWRTKTVSPGWMRWASAARALRPVSTSTARPSGQ